MTYCYKFKINYILAVASKGGSMNIPEVTHLDKNPLYPK